ncbi:MAG: ABC transporter permease [Verrucomicrobiae bacterium]|nr:ABC transporter permease [Verrucomicrobiae bacterium]
MTNLKFALRQLLKNPGFTAVAVFTLAFGIGANTAIFSVINGVLLRPLPYPEPDRLVMLWERHPQRGVEQEAVTPPNYADWKAQSRAFEQMAYWNGVEPVNLVAKDGVEKARRAYVESSLFPVLRAAPLLGRAFLPEEDQYQGNPVAILSHELWQRRFGGDPDVLGQTLTLGAVNGREFTIVGVMPPGFRFPDNCDLWLPSGWNGVPGDRRGGHWLSVIARLKPGVSLAQARTEMSGIQAWLEQQYREAFIGSDVAVVPLIEQTVGRTAQRALWVLWGVVAGVLLIACANVANLLLARAAGRRKEIALRAALGASRWQIARQLLTESVLLSLAGGGVGVLLAIGGLRLFVAAAAHQIPRLQNVALDGSALMFTLVVAVLTGVLFGLAPAWQFSRPDVHEVLKDTGRGGSAGRRVGRMRNALVVSEIALSLVLLLGAGLMLQSFARLAWMDRGFNPEHLLTAQIDFHDTGFGGWTQPTNTRPHVPLHELMERLRQHPGIQAAGAVTALPAQSGGPPGQPILIEGRPATGLDDLPKTEGYAVTPDYFRALGVPLLRGRDFTEADQLRAPRVRIINETFARRYFPNEDPIGKRLAAPDPNNPLQPAGRAPWDPPDWPGPWCEIVGVVADIKNFSLHPEPGPQAFVPYWQSPLYDPVLVIRAIGDPAALAAVVRGETKAVSAALPAPTIRTMDQVIAETVTQPRFHSGLLGLFAALALMLAAIGLYGLLAYAVTQRTQEIGIRLALGAQQRNVLALVIGQGMKLALLGAGIGLVLALALTRLLRTLLYEIHPSDPATFGGVSVLLLGIALLACWLPARRAARVDPGVALRAE